jgi:RNA-directed DNA polymerase
MNKYPELFEYLEYAYSCAVRGKSKRKEIQERNQHHEKNIKKLYNDIVSGNYQIGRSKRYIVKDPVIREIVVIPFRDRIIQHLVAYYLTPLFELQRIYDSYANRVGKGTLLGIQRMDHHIRSVSHNYTREARILKCDIQSCFMSLSRTLVRELVTRRVFAVTTLWDKSLILSLINTIIFHDYVTGRYDCTSSAMRNILPVKKSMINCLPWHGFPLWNLTSHLFANIMLHELDLFVKHELHIPWYGRYVDDFVCIHPDQEYLKTCIHRIACFLKEHLCLSLHPKKIYFQPVTHGVLFLGVNIKPYCRLVGKRIIKKSTHLVNNTPKNHSVDTGKTVAQRINSYLGLMRHHSSFALRKWMIKSLPPFWYDELRVRKWYLSVKPRRRVIEATQKTS